MKRFIRQVSVTLKRKWRNAGGFDVMVTSGSIVAICGALVSFYFAVILRDPYIPMSIKLYWGVFIGSIFLFFLYSVKHYA
ncbi:hypothetical protein A2Z10_03280 [Candidatus Azambacteria bacterium RBG_16_47_10]|uniref:Uncharacterized protein n=1 Tax=Candidatus Azambacteria bacterium RBG_16_47_10 TaxID=1797292 RepID=A0A1F5B0V0_9BACT|nr:MAG: hypothetical protein A2Z10_03280 [Candidatus Azambacteria bacterium RBG_16_47_10]